MKIVVREVKRNENLGGPAEGDPRRGVPAKVLRRRRGFLKGEGFLKGGVSKGAWKGGGEGGLERGEGGELRKGRGGELRKGGGGEAL